MSEVAIISGGGSGIGAGVACKLATRGAAVVLLDRNGPAMQKVLQEIKSVGGVGCADVVDVTDSKALSRAVERIAGELGRPSTVVACAGVAAIGRITDMPEAVLDQLIAVNLKGVCLLARATIPYLERGGGTFTAIASDAGILGFQGFAAYCASKHAIIGLIKSMALDHGPNQVRSNAVCPGYVETPMLDQLLVELQGDRSAFEKAIPLGRFARVEDIANVAYLSSPAAAYANGTILSVDGGSTAGPFVPA